MQFKYVAVIVRQLNRKTISFWIRKHFSKIQQVDYTNTAQSLLLPHDALIEGLQQLL